MTRTAEHVNDAAIQPGGTPLLNAALAAFQAEVPKITKDEKAKIEGVSPKTGMPFSYPYSYANLAAICAVASPLLGKHGLAFSARPTLIDGKFCLAYELRHSSGEELPGVMPLPSSGKPQDLGSLLTYYRRYAMCAVCNIAPTEDDNDAATANHEQRFDTRSAAEAFENATPAPPRRQQQAGPNGAAVRPEQQNRPGISATELDLDAQQYADEAHEANNVNAVKDIHVRAREAHKLAALITNPATGGKGGLGQYLNWRKGVLEKADKALAAVEAAGQALGLSKAETVKEFERLAGCSIEAATTEQLEQAAAKFASLEPAAAGG